MNILNKKDRKIDGWPTKELFVNILTRDLSIDDAINDLIDNSIDGAKRLRPDGNYKGLFINIIINKDEFSISDNCGGINIEIARHYAFRFGRPSGMPSTDFSIGQFGVGMKRAFFKLGRSFYVESTHSTSRFAIIEDINKWLTKINIDGTDDWSFEFEEDFIENQTFPIESTGTKIEIQPLHEDVANFIDKTNFVNQELKRKIEQKHMESIYRELSLSVNNEKLRCIRPTFLVSDKINIVEYNHKFDNGVSLKINAGISELAEDFGGWYIFCNNRLLLGPETTALTGWTGKGGDGVALYHQQYYRFRGLAFFEAENSINLPWNTSKNNIDASSPIFLFARGKMIEYMKQVFNLLNLEKEDRERLPDGTEKEYTPYIDMIRDAKIVEIQNIRSENIKATFNFPKPPTKKEEIKNVKITYTKPKYVVDIIKDHLGVKSNTEVGELTFDYFVNLEDIDINE